MSDGESLRRTAKNNRSELDGFVMSIAKSFNVKIAALLFMLLLFVNTTLYIEQILSNFGGAVEPGNNVTGKGVLITNVLVVIIYLIMDSLVQAGYL